MHGGIFLAVLADLLGARSIGEARFLLDRQPVHVGADQDQRPLAVLEDRDHPGAAHAGRHLEPGRLELGRHLGRGAVFEEAEFGVLVEVEEKRREVIVVFRLDRLLRRLILGKHRLGGGGGEREGARGEVEQAHV